MTAKWMMMAPVSAVQPAALLFDVRIANEPAATVVTLTAVFPPSEPDRCETTITSPISTAELVTVNTAGAGPIADAANPGGADALDGLRGFDLAAHRQVPARIEDAAQLRIVHSV